MTTDLALRTHLATVARTTQLTPAVRRITFTGDSPPTSSSTCSCRRPAATS
jgi:NADPH-dependent ferric siderophore reductase